MKVTTRVTAVEIKVYHQTTLTPHWYWTVSPYPGAPTEDEAIDQALVHLDQQLPCILELSD